MSRSRRFIACWTLLGVLFAQLAVAAYACPKVESGPPSSAVGVMAGMSAEECAGMESTLPAGASPLCAEHCKPDTHLVDVHPLHDLGGCATSVAPLLVTARVEAGAWASVSRFAFANGPPPLSLSRRFRI